MVSLFLSPSFNVQGYQIKDLTSTTPQLFDFQAQLWTASGLVSTSKTSTCGSYPLLGGFNTLNYGGYYQRTYTSLPSHSAISYEISFFILDVWHSGDTIQVSFDGNVQTAGSPSAYASSFPSNVCGQSANDLTTFTMIGDIFHSSSSLTLQIKSGVNRAASVASFGIKGVSLSFKSPLLMLTQDACFYVLDNAVVNGQNGECTTAKGEYIALLFTTSCDPSCSDCSAGTSSDCYACSAGYSFTGSSCVKCDSSCNTCSGTGANQCVTCASGLWLYANNTCKSTCTLPSTHQQVIDDFKLCQWPCLTSEYLLYNQTCVSSCLSPLVASTVGTEQYCNKPCSDGLFLGWTNTCVSTCPTPLIQIVEQNVSLCSKPCNTSEYLDWSNACVATCSSPLVQYVEQNVSRCKKPCASGEYLDWTNTCVPTCTSPLVQFVDQGVDRCKKPCADSLYLDWTNICVSTCPTPLIQSVEQNVSLCSKPCNASEYLDWTNTCITACTFPLAQDTDQGVDLCKKPCASGEFLDWNTNCATSCSSPLIQAIEQGVDLCKLPCNSSQYLYPNNTCMDDCSPPLTLQTVNLVMVCEYPCNFAANYFINWDGSCVSTCGISQQRIVNDFRYCDQASEGQLSEADIEQVKQLNSTLAVTGTIASIGATTLAFASSGSPTALSLSSLVKMLQYIRYINIRYPSKLELILSNLNDNTISLNFGPDLPNDLKADFPHHNLSGKFDQYKVPSSFAVNFGEAFITQILVVLIMIICIIICFLFKKYRYVYIFFDKIKGITKWDLFLLILCSNFDGIALFSSFEFKTLQLDSTLAIVSFITCLCTNILAVFILGKLLYIIIDIRKTNYISINPTRSQNRVIPKRQKWKSYRILFERFKDHSFLQQAYMFFFLIRVFIFDIIIGYLFLYPLIQSVLIFTLSILMLSLLIIKRPFKEKYDLLEFIINEAILFIVNFNVVILAIIDHVDPTSEYIRQICGEIIIGCNLAYRILAVVMLLFEIVMRLYDAYKKYKELKAKGQPFNIFSFFLQSDSTDSKDEQNIKKISPTSVIDIKEKFTSETNRHDPFSFLLSNRMSQIIDKGPESARKLLILSKESSDIKSISGLAPSEVSSPNTSMAPLDMKGFIQSKFFPSKNMSSTEENLSGTEKLEDVDPKRGSLLYRGSIVLNKELDMGESITSFGSLLGPPSSTNKFNPRRSSRWLLNPNMRNQDSPKSDTPSFAANNLTPEKFQVESLTFSENPFVKMRFGRFMNSERNLRGSSFRGPMKPKIKTVAEFAEDKEGEQ